MCPPLLQNSVTHGYPGTVIISWFAPALALMFRYLTTLLAVGLNPFSENRGTLSQRLPKLVHVRRVYNAIGYKVYPPQRSTPWHQAP